MTTLQLLILLTLGLPLIGALGVMLVQGERARNRLAVVFAGGAALCALLMFPNAQAADALTLPVASVDATFAPDGLGVFLALIAASIGCITLIFSADYMHGEPQLGRYYALVLIFISAMCGLVLTSSLLLLLIFWEITALCSYALIAFHNDDPKAVAAGIRALIVTQLGGVGLLLGVLLIRAGLGTDSLTVALATMGAMPADLLTLTAFGFLWAAAAKSAQFPFHIWLPGAMEAPTPISALIHAATMVNAGVYLLARFYPAFESVIGWRETVLFIGAASALLGAVMALTSADLKRALAYSTVSQLGFMVYAVGCGGIVASQFHLMSHAVFKALLFLSAGAIIHALGTRELAHMGGLGRVMPFTRLAFGVGVLALMGVPMFNGFWSKELIFEASLTGAPQFFTVVMLFTAGLTALYAVRLMMLVFYGQARAEHHAHDAPPMMRVALGVLSFATLTTWLLANPFAALLHETLPAHALEIHGDLLLEVISAPITLMALAVITVGAGLWFVRGLFTPLMSLWRALTRISDTDFGFSPLAVWVTRGTQGAGGALRILHSGQLNWNAAGIVGGVAIVLAVLTLGGAL